MKTHGMKDTRTYRIWSSMKKRCQNPNSTYYHLYGGRGIYVCDKWQSFEGFLSDMSEAPSGLTLERDQNDGPYAEWNCRWATRREQTRNTRSNHLITLNSATMPLCDWAEMLGINAPMIRKRLKRGWSVRNALTQPVRRKANG